MFQLYKNRNFSEIINDTFTFFRVMGKNYFSNYIKITSGFLIVMLLLMYLAGNIFFENIFSGMQTPEQQQMLSKYFNDNSGYFIAAGILCGLLLLIITGITYAYPVVYMRIMENNVTPQASQIIKGLKWSMWKVIKFILFSFITFIPIGVLLCIISVLLITIIIGIPVAIIVFAFLSCWIFLTFYDYLNNDYSFFTALSKGYNLVFINFWGHTGATAIFYIIMYLMQGAVTLLFYLITGTLTMLDVQPDAHTDAVNTLGILALISFMISIALSYLLSNLLMVSQGIIYYSGRESNENNTLEANIDLIGSDIE